MCRSERNIRPIVRVKVTAPGQGLGPDNVTDTSVLCISSILKTTFEGGESTGESTQAVTQHTLVALASGSALGLAGPSSEPGLQALYKASTPPEGPSKVR